MLKEKNILDNATIIFMIVFMVSFACNLLFFSNPEFIEMKEYYLNFDNFDESYRYIGGIHVFVFMLSPFFMTRAHRAFIKDQESLKKPYPFKGKIKADTAKIPNQSHMWEAASLGMLSILVAERGLDLFNLYNTNSTIPFIFMYSGLYICFLKVLQYLSNNEYLDWMRLLLGIPGAAMIGFYIGFMINIILNIIAMLWYTVTG